MKTTPAPNEGFPLRVGSRAAIANHPDDLVPRVEYRRVGGMRPARPDFSLVLGGPLFQLYRRAHLSGDALELLHLRILVITPLARLSRFHSCTTSRRTFDSWLRCRRSSLPRL